MRNLLKHTLIWLLLAVAPAAAQTLTEEDVKRLALEAILENPEIIMEAVAILQAQDEQAEQANTARVLSEQRIMLERDSNAPVLGNPDGDITVVEFFDYNCPYCKQVAPEIEALIAADENVRLVYREWPILGEGSIFATKAALAARNQGKYEEFHWALMALRGRAEEASVRAVARKLGLNMDQLLADMQASEIEDHIQVSMNLARLLGFNGTPSFVIGEALVPGLVPLDELERLVEAARESQ